MIKIPSPVGSLLSFLDGGSDCTFLKPSVYDKFLRANKTSYVRSSRSVTVANRAPIDISAECDVPFTLNGKTFVHRMLVSPDLQFKGACLLGNDFYP